MPSNEHQRPAPKQAEDTRHRLNRREFLGTFGTALGGVTLIGGGNFLLGQSAALPSGYKFYRVLTTGQPLPIGSTNPVKTVGAAVMLGSFELPDKPGQSDVLYFHGTSTSSGEPQALFQAELSYESSSGDPILTYVSVAVAQGDELRDVSGVPQDELPIVVGTLGIGSANSSAKYATTISVNDYGDESSDGSVQAKSAPGVYLYDPFSQSWEKVARLGDDSPDGGQYGGFFGDVTLNEDGSVVFTAATTAPPNPPAVAGYARRSRVPWYVGSHALVQSIPGSPLDSSVILKTGDLLPGTAAVVEGFGLIDAVNGEQYVAQVNARRLDILSAQAGTAIVRGRLNSRRNLETSPEVELLSGSPRLFPSGIARTLETLVGESIIGPRIGFGGLTALVTHDALTIPGAGSFDLQRLSTWG